MMNHIHRTYEPFRFLSRFTLFPMSNISQGTPVLTRTVTHESDPPWRWAPTFVLRFGPTRWGVAVGWWLDSGVSGSLTEEFQHRVAQENMASEFDRYVVANGDVDYDTWYQARLRVAEKGLDPDDDLEIQMAMVEGV